MGIGLSWYQKETNNNWTYDLTNHLIAYLEIIIALASMTCIVDLNGCELHSGDEKSSTTLLMNARVSHYTYDRGSLSFKSGFVKLC